MPGKPRQFVHPAMDVHYNNKPSMISEIAWCRPNRFRSEAPLYLAAYGKGFLVINAARAQGVSGQLKTAGPVHTKDLAIASDMEIGHIIAVSLDNQPLATSGRILLQIMSEEKATGFRTEPATATIKRITDIGRDPWQVKELTGTVRFNRPMKITALDTHRDYRFAVLDHQRRCQCDRGSFAGFHNVGVFLVVRTRSETNQPTTEPNPRIPDFPFIAPAARSGHHHIAPAVGDDACRRILIRSGVAYIVPHLGLHPGNRILRLQAGGRTRGTEDNAERELLRHLPEGGGAMKHFLHLYDRGDTDQGPAPVLVLDVVCLFKGRCGSFAGRICLRPVVLFLNPARPHGRNGGERHRLQRELFGAWHRCREYCRPELANPLGCRCVPHGNDGRRPWQSQ